MFYNLLKKIRLMIQNLFLIFTEKLIIQENVCCRYIYSDTLFPFNSLSEQQSRANLRHFHGSYKHTDYKMKQHALPESEGEKCQQMENKNIRLKFNPH